MNICCCPLLSGDQHRYRVHGMRVKFSRCGSLGQRLGLSDPGRAMQAFCFLSNLLKNAAASLKLYPRQSERFPSSFLLESSPVYLYVVI